ncbi:hypothetical protein SAMN05216375_11643 [Trichococcus ilyis]|jgi:hypothetical protein|uniref:Uncharacterized protein n=1 Tax=Trichococcus ilyis TaxID=640938 RepID=A0A143YTS3_9LACT|nr:hypothetical protein [Trichococcus ilyis]CZQ96884.1 Hypothetical protein TR210_1427 [Trichococcus ilyis]SEJ53064.1 hypothetical protein SAMN05216375_11643 [Trichococcus ilyis]
MTDVRISDKEWAAPDRKNRQKTKNAAKKNRSEHIQHARLRLFAFYSVMPKS